MEDLYEEFKKRFDLPDLDLLDDEFEVGTVDDDHFLLRHIRRKIVEKFDDIRRVLDNVIQTETNIVSMREASAFSDDEKHRVLALYRKLMFFERQSFELDISTDEVKDAAFINDVTTFWKDAKKELLIYAAKIKECWHQDTAQMEIAGYFG